MTIDLKVPAGAGSRRQAAELCAPLSNLGGQALRLNCQELRFATPSFFDEIVKQVLVERNAARLEIVAASSRGQELVERAARNRGVENRIAFLSAAA